MNTSIPKNVLFDFFEGKATSLQRRLIEEWLAHPENEILYFQWLNEWESQHPQYMPETEQALQRFKGLMNDSDSQTPPRINDVSTEQFTPTINRFWRKWAIAASIIFLVGISAIFFQRTLRYERFQTGNAQTKSILLSDGTRVTLNANSNLYVPRWGFAKTHRQVVLEGEAEFVVSHTADHQRFVVQTDDDFNVEVLGTEFVLFTRERGKKVILNKGSVKVHYQEGKQLALKPGDMITFNSLDSRPQLRKFNPQHVHNAWKNHQFYFDNTPLSEVGEIIKEHFGVEVVLTDTSLSQRRLSGYFKADTPQEIAQIIATLLNISIEQTEKRLVIHNPSSKNL